MQPLSLLIVPYLGLLTLTQATSPNPPLSSCILGGDPCPTGSICTQTSTCGGLCISTPTLPPQIPCTVGNNGPCPTGSTCTPTMFCTAPATPCGGACIATAQPPLTSQALPSVTCVVGANDCPAPSFCTQTQVCGGLCLGTAVTPPPPTHTPQKCGGYHHKKCPKGYKCRHGVCVKK